MPPTLFHVVSALALGLVLLKYLDFPTLLVASVIPDLAEPFLFLLFDHHDPLVVGLSHRFFHSLPGTTMLAVLTAIILYALGRWLNDPLKKFNLQQEISVIRISYTAILGAYFHVLLDAVGYSPTLAAYLLLFLFDAILLYLRFKENFKGKSLGIVLTSPTSAPRQESPVRQCS